MTRSYLALLVLFTTSQSNAIELKPETAAAFDTYVKGTEEDFAKHKGRDFLWLSRHPKEKSLVWLNQSQILPQKVDIDVPDGTIQHWLGVVFLPGATLERAVTMALDYANYKVFFKQQVVDSKLVKRDGNRFDAQVRLRKRQVLPVVLNANLTAQFASIDGNRASIDCRSTRIGEVKNPGKKASYDEERPAGEESGYLWRLNMYWRLEQADNGVYAEIDLITLSREAGLRPERVLKGFIQNFPGEFMEGVIEGLRLGFPASHR